MLSMQKFRQSYKNGPPSKLSHSHILFAFCQKWLQHISSSKHVPVLAQQMGASSARKEGYLSVDADLKCMCAHTHNPPLGHVFLICV